MAIAPIDLQTLFAQVDKVGKAQTAQKEGQAIHQAMHGAHIQRKTEEDIRQINETQNMGDGAEKIKDHPSRQKNKNQKRNTEDGSSSDEEEINIEETQERINNIFRDPSLGNRIDIRQ